MAAFAALAACAAPAPLPEYAGAVDPEQPLLVVIPGLLASRLVDADTGRRVWPPNLAMLILGWRMRDLALPLPDRRSAARSLRPSDVLLSRPRRDYYSGLLDALTAAGYECSSQHDFDRDTNCLLFAWDWRRGFVEAASDLADAVERIQTERGEPGAPIDVVGHSAGALIARYYARHGRRGLDSAPTPARADTVAAGTNVRRVILVGPPNQGSIFGAYALMHGYPLGIFTVQPEILATFDTAYQLLPHPDRQWAVDAHGEPAELDLYDVETWRAFEVSIFDPEVRARAASRLASDDDAESYLAALEARFADGLKRARLFHEALWAVEPAEGGHTEYLVLASDCVLTPRYFLTGTATDRGVLNLDPESVHEPMPGVDYEALMLAPGDGRVTRESALSLARSGPGSGPADSAISFDVVCERHSEMTSNARVRREVLEFLLDTAPNVAASADAGP